MTWRLVEIHVPQDLMAGTRGLPIEWNFAVDQWSKARHEKCAGDWWGDPVIFTDNDSEPRRAKVD